MYRIFLALAAAFALVALPAQGRAQIQAGPYVAFHDDMDLGIGAFVGAPFTSMDENLSFVADLGIYFPDDEGSSRDRDYWEINGNMLYSFPLPDQEFTPWALGGVNIGRYSTSRDDPPDGPGGSSHSETDIGLNLGGGVTFGSGSTRPFVGVKFELGGGDGGVLFGGVSFLVGEGL